MTHITIDGKRYDRKPRPPVRNLGIIFLDRALYNIYHAYFLVNKKMVPGISFDRKNWVVAVKEDDRFIVGELFSEIGLTQREMELIDFSGVFYY